MFAAHYETTYSMAFLFIQIKLQGPPQLDLLMWKSI